MPRRVDGVKPKLARTYATHPSRASGNDLEVVQEQLGHASIETTTIYAKVA
jgi:site-specific recombinase XerC